jgi:leader peptidase (prepilin peptidase)/N-methyltransferase
MTVLVFGGLGLIIGSFLNVLILRWGEKGLGGRSACMSCGAQIRWYDNIPLLSWLLLRGRCRDCHARISVQYPLVELMTAVIFVLIGTASIPVDALYRAVFCLIAALLVAIAVYDLYHTIIPDAWVYSFDILAFIVMGPLLLASAPPDTSVLLYIAAGPIAALPIFALWAVSRGEWMGFGDVKLALGMGWLLGPAYGIAAVFFGFVIGAVISLGILLPLPHIIGALRKLGITPLGEGAKGFTMKSEIPFGPFLVASTFIVWLLLINNLDPFFFVGLSPW